MIFSWVQNAESIAKIKIDPTKNYYNILEVAPNSTSGKIEDSWKKLRSRLHPDKAVDDPTMDRKFKDAQEAYQILSNVLLRRDYDRMISKPGWIWRNPFRSQSTKSENPKPNYEPPKPSPPTPDQLRNLFRQTHNAEIYEQLWKENVNSASGPHKLVFSLRVTLNHIAATETLAFANPLYQNCLSIEVNKFLKAAWDEIQNNEVIDGDVSSDYQELYWSVLRIRNLQLEAHQEPLDGIPKYILRTAYLAAASSERRADVLLFSSQNDLSDSEIAEWVSPYSWIDRHTIAQEILLRFSETYPQRNFVNDKVKTFAAEQLRGSVGTLKTFLVQCLGYMRF